MQLQNMPLGKFIFLDIQSAARQAKLSQNDAAMQLFWQQKFGDEPNDYAQQAALIPEFAQVVCASVGGLVLGADQQFTLKVKTFVHSNESTLLAQFAQALGQYKPADRRILIGHNIKEFDLPFLCKRLIINDLNMPNILNISGLKPWDMPVLDTMQWWQFGSFKGGISLRLLAHSLGIGYPDVLQYAQNNKILQQDYHENKENTVQKFMERCQQNVVLLAQIALKIQQNKLLTPDKVDFL
jgi:hypothetical protein